MGLRAGWLALFIFVWLIGAFLGSTFEYQSTEGSEGVSYTTGTATFTNGSYVVTSGGGAVWTDTMEGGNIKSDTDDIWTKIRHVGGGYIASGTGKVTGSPLTLDVGANTPTISTLGTINIVLPSGNTGTASTNTTGVFGSPVALVAGTNTISTIGSTGNISVTVAGSTVIFLYSPYSGAGGAGLAYTMAVSPGWAGSGTAGYAQSPVTTLEYLLNISNAFQKLPILGDIPLPVPNPEYFKSVYEVVTWQWSFMEGYEMFYWIFLAPFVIMGVLSIILLTYGILTGNLTIS